jgi:ribosome recycling factor
MATLKSIYEDVSSRMKKTTENFRSEISRIRTGRATPALLEGVQVDYYGQQVPLNQISGIAVPEARLLVLQPYDKNAIAEIERAINKAGLGLNPQNDGNVIRIPIPILSDERRSDLVKLVRKLAEDARIAVRNIRRDGIEKVKSLEKGKEISEDQAKDADKRIQEITDEATDQIEEILNKKEKEIEDE